MEYETILLERISGHSKIVLLTINRPKVLNALNKQVITELDAAVSDIEKMNDVGAVIITGAGGRAFVAGADIGELQGMDCRQAYGLARRGQQLYNRIEQLDKIVIAAVNGFALGGGCELSMACDIRVATEKSKFGVPETSLGTIPGYGGTQRLPRLVGTGIAKEMMFSAKPVSAVRAYEMGLVNRVVTENEDLMETAIEMAETMLKNSPYAIATAKKAVNEGMEMELYRAIQHEAALFSTTYGVPDTKEGISAFLEKRKPDFWAEK